MEKKIKYLAERFYRPLLVRYLSKTRMYGYQGIRLEIPSGVFHPGFFFSTKFLLRFLADLPLKEKTFLEPGAGSGLISLFAARQGARVTATDINPLAVECLLKNSALNDIPIEVLHSDLFTRIPRKPFDIIAINPPYYRKHPVTDAEKAWFCGPHGEFFEAFFGGLNPYVHDKTEIFMVLCEGCDLEMIRNRAAANGWKLRCIRTQKNLIEEDYIFQITRK